MKKSKKTAKRKAKTKAPSRAKTPVTLKDVVTAVRAAGGTVTFSLVPASPVAEDSRPLLKSSSEDWPGTPATRVVMASRECTETDVAQVFKTNPAAQWVVTPFEIVERAKFCALKQESASEQSASKTQIDMNTKIIRQAMAALLAQSGAKDTDINPDAALINRALEELNHIDRVLASLKVELDQPDTAEQPQGHAGAKAADVDRVFNLNAESAYCCARDVIKGRWPEAEAVIMKDAEWANEYALYVIKGRWPEAEPVIMKDAEWAYAYALHAIKGRWPEAEAVIMKDARWAHWYVLHVIKGRWPEAEAMIMQDAGRAYWYACDVIKGRWPEAEPVIMQSAEWAYAYALHVIKGRWPEAEPVIMQSAQWAYWYARDVIKGRWPEAEAMTSGTPLT